MKLRKIVAVLMALICLTSCEKVPQKVLDNQKNYKQNNQVAKSKVEYCTLDELKKTDITRIKYDNLKLPKEVYFDNIQGVYKIEGRVPEGFLNKKKQILSDFGLSETLELTKEEQLSVDEGLSYSKDFYIGFNDAGVLSYMKENDENNTFYDDCFSYYYLTQKKNRENKQFKKLIAQAEKDVKKDLWDSRIDFIPEYVSLSNKDKKATVCGTFGYKGIGLFSLYTYRMIKGKTSPSKWDMVKCLYNMEEGISYEGYYQTAGCVINKTHKINKVVSLKSAIRIVSDKLSGFSEVRIRDIYPSYLCVKKAMSKGWPYTSGKEVKFRPVYIFRVKHLEGNRKYDETGDLIFFVDMITGEYSDDLFMRKK